MQVPFEPSAFPSAGRTCLIYELNLSNFESRPVTIDRADVLDADDEQTNSACYAHGKRVLAVADGIEGHRQLPS
jgi:hypothetical protein